MKWYVFVDLPALRSPKLKRMRIEVSSRIREDLLQRAGEFNITLEDVSITHLTFGKVGPTLFS